MPANSVGDEKDIALRQQKSVRYVISTMIQHKILFICTHNSSRSQMAEAFLNHYAGDVFRAESAGVEKSILNPRVVKVMQEAGIDISHKGTQEAFDLVKEGRLYQAVITVCDVAAETCPIFPGLVKRLSWSFPDPAKFTGTEEEILEQTRKVRDGIKDKVLKFIEEAKDVAFWS